MPGQSKLLIVNGQAVIDNLRVQGLHELGMRDDPMSLS
jgi:hypothetical protein